MSYVWRECSLTATRPLARGGHASAVLTLPGADTATPSTAATKVVVIVGGADAFGASYNDVHVVEVAEAIEEAGEKDKVKEAAVPCRCVQVQANGSTTCPFTARMGHSMAAVPADVDLLPLLEQDKGKEKDAVGAHPKEEDTIVAPAAPSTQPQGRPAQVRVWSQPAVLFGGMSALPEPALHNTLFMLRIDATAAAKAASSKGDQPPAHLVDWRCFPADAMAGTVPSPRHAHASGIVPDTASLLVVGGSDDNRPLGDAYVCHLPTLTWRRITLPAAFPPREMSALACLPCLPLLAAAATGATATGSNACAKPLAVLFGGRDEDGLPLADVHAIQCNNITGKPCSSATATDGEGGEWSIRLVSAGLPDDRRCCHVLVSVPHPSSSSETAGATTSSATSSAVAAIGGFTMAGLPLSDLVLSAADGAVLDRPVRVLAHKAAGTEVHFGLGHSLATDAAHTTAFVVGGIHPNTASSSLELFQLVRRAQ